MKKKVFITKLVLNKKDILPLIAIQADRVKGGATVTVTCRCPTYRICPQPATNGDASCECSWYLKCTE